MSCFRWYGLRRSSPAIFILVSFVLSISSEVVLSDDKGLMKKSVVWFANHNAVHAVDTATNQIVHIISQSQEISDIVVDPIDRSLWVLSHKKLYKYDGSAD